MVPSLIGCAFFGHPKAMDIAEVGSDAKSDD